MAFGDVKTPQGLKELNNFLADNSYISGYTPSKADLSVFDALGKAPAGDDAHVARWYRHIASFEAGERSAWTGAPLPQLAGAKPTVAAADDDDDVDLFGTDEEDDAEAERIKAERVAAYAANKSKQPALIAESSVLLDVKPWDDETDMKQMERFVGPWAMASINCRICASLKTRRSLLICCRRRLRSSRTSCSPSILLLGVMFDYC